MEGSTVRRLDIIPTFGVVSPHSPGSLSEPTIRSSPRRSNPIAVVAKSRAYLLALLSALLLFAQHVALTHAVWHQANAPAGSHALAERPAPSHDSRHASALCDFDAMLGQLLAGGAVASAACVLTSPAAHAFGLDVRHLADLTPIQPRSRGPPLAL
jgi:hypothetical protein